MEGKSGQFVVLEPPLGEISAVDTTNNQTCNCIGHFDDCVLDRSPVAVNVRKNIFV